MRASRGLIMLAAITVAAVAACGFAIAARYSEAAINKQNGGLVFPEFQNQLDAIANIEITGVNKRIVLSYGQDGWQNQAMGGYPAKTTLVENALAAIANLAYIKPKTERTNLHSKLGVEDVNADSKSAQGKSTRVTVKDANNKVLADIIVGNPKETIVGTNAPGVYIRLPNEKRAWLAAGPLDVKHNPPDWSNRMVVDIPAQDLITLNIRHTDGAVVELYRDKPDDKQFTLKNLPDGSKVQNQHQIDYLAGLLRGLKFIDAKHVADSDTGFGPVFEIMAHSNQHQAVTIRAGEPEEDGSVWAKVDAQITNHTLASSQTKEDVARIKASFDGWIVKLPRAVTEKLKLRLGDIIAAKP